MFAAVFGNGDAHAWIPLVGYVWLGAAAFVVLVTIVPPLRVIAEHGKRAVSGGGGGATSWWNLQVPKAWFAHFYVWGLVWHLVWATLLWTGNVPKVVLRLMFLSHGIEGGADATMMQQTRVLLCAMLCAAHLARRIWECHFMTRYGSSTMHVGAYFVGMMHYFLVPLTLLSVHADLYDDWLDTVHSMTFRDGLRHLVAELHTQAGARIVLAGVLLVVLGSKHQYECHKILHYIGGKRLKTNRQTGQTDTTKRYELPTGDWFNYVACPHYFAEILIYLGFLFILQDVLTLTMLIWVVTNLGVVAHGTRQWYEDKFEDCPSRREWKALVPGVW